MQPRRLRLKVDLYLGAEASYELVERTTFGRADVRGGEDADADPATLELRERFFEDAEAVPADEGAEQIDRVSGGEFAAELGAENGLVLRVGEKGRVGQGSRGAGEWGGVKAGRSQREKLLTHPRHGRVSCVEVIEEVVDDRYSICGFGVGEARPHDLVDTPR